MGKIKPTKKWSCTECSAKGDTVQSHRDHIDLMHMDGILDKVLDFFFGWKL